MVIWANYLQSFHVYYHEGIYSVDQKAMPSDRMTALHRMLPDDFYYIDEIRKTYARLYPDADMEEINPYNLKSMGWRNESRIMNCGLFVSCFSLKNRTSFLVIVVVTVQVAPQFFPEFRLFSGYIFQSVDEVGENYLGDILNTKYFSYCAGIP